MSFQCQRDSYLQRFVTTVVSCEEAKHNSQKVYEVVLKDTVLFPEGGGQPDDRGTINGVPVLRVWRKGEAAVHVTDTPFEVGLQVEQEVDWGRRFDHMQQHSGQHLITAIAECLYGFKTTSWYLNVGVNNKCFVELATGNIANDQMQTIEDRCNSCIRQRLAMTPRWLDPDDPKLQQVKSRGLPDDFAGQVRVVSIDGVDDNACCGTHVSNLSDIQAIKLLHTENKRGSTLVYYLAGSRVFHYMNQAVGTEQKLTRLLSVGPDEHCEAVDRMLRVNRQMAKTSRNRLRELAQLLAFRHLNSDPVDSVAIFHRDDGDNEFMNILATQLQGKVKLLLVTVGADKGNGQFLVAGEDSVVPSLGPKVAELLEGKGNGKGGRFQGKATKLQRRDQAEALVRSFF